MIQPPTPAIQLNDMEHPLPAKIDWTIESMRLSVFPSSVTDVGTINWWQETIGAPPDSRTIQPKLGGLQEIGSIKNGLCNLTLECQPNRIDWVFSPPIKEPQALHDFPTFTDLKGGRELFREITSKWIKNCPLANRIAFGAVLIGRTDSRKAAYELLATYLPAVKLDPDNSSDFSYQINRPRPSKIMPDITINRLSRWAAIRLSGMVIQLSAGQAQVFESAQDINACRLEVDINTSPQFKGPIEAARVMALLDELVTLGTEMAEAGDVP